MLWLSDAGKDYALHNIQSCIPPVNDSEKEALIFSDPPVPAIVRRQETAEDKLLCIGFSSFRVIDGTRLRIGCKVPLNCIVEHKTPFEVAACKKPKIPEYQFLDALVDAGKRHHIQVGVFGSAALQIVTGLSYLQKNSDLDIYLRHQGSRKDLELFYQQLTGYEKQFGITIDAEIEFPDQYGVKLKELFGPGKTVLGKGLYDVVLLEKRSFPEF